MSAQCFFWKTANIFQKNMIVQYCNCCTLSAICFFKHLWVGSSDIVPRSLIDISPVKIMTFDYLFFFFSPIPWTFLSPHDSFWIIWLWSWYEKQGWSLFFTSYSDPNPTLPINLLFTARSGIIFQLCKAIDLSPLIAWNGSTRIKYLSTKWAQGLLEI